VPSFFHTISPARKPSRAASYRLLIGSYSWAEELSTASDLDGCGAAAGVGERRRQRGRRRGDLKPARSRLAVDLPRIRVPVSAGAGAHVPVLAFEDELTACRDDTVELHPPLADRQARVVHRAGEGDDGVGDGRGGPGERLQLRRGAGDAGDGGR